MMINNSNNILELKCKIIFDAQILGNNIFYYLFKLGIAGLLSFTVMHAHSAVQCQADGNGSYLTGDTNPTYKVDYDTVLAATVTLPAAATWYVLARQSSTTGSKPVSIGDSNVTINTASNGGGFTGVANQYGTGPGTSITTGSLSFNVTTTGNAAVPNGLGTKGMVPLTVNGTYDFTVSANYTGGNSSAGVEMYGVVAGSPNDTVEQAAMNGKFSTVTLQKNVNLNQTTKGGVDNADS